MEAVLLLFLLLLGFIVANFPRIRKKREGWGKLELPPSPPGLPIIGNLHQLGKNPHRALRQLAKQYGPVMRLRLGVVPAVVVSSSQMAEEVLKTNDLLLCSRPTTTAFKRLAYNFSDVAFSPYTAAWRELRKIMVVKLFNTVKVASFRPAREEEVERMIASISRLSSISKPVNVSALMHTLGYSITSKVAFGRGLHKEKTNEETTEFRRILVETQALLVGFFAADYFPWGGWLDSLFGRRARLEKNYSEMDAFCQLVIAAHENPADIKEEQEDIVDMLLRIQKESDELTMDNIKGAIMNITAGGSDTMSATLEFAMAELMRHPSIMLKAQEEVRRVGDVKGRVEESEISQLGYLKSVVKETLRLHPVVPLLVHREAMGRVKIGGYDILPKTRVIVNAWAIARDPDFWEHPDQFIPERFIGSTVNFKGCHFQFLPFGAGRRMCPGLDFGVMTVELALANLLYAFDWELPDDKKERGIDMDESTGVTVHLKNHLYLKATRFVPHEH